MYAYLTFCLGCGFMIAAGARTYERRDARAHWVGHPNVLGSPLWMSGPKMRFSLNLLPFILLVAQIAIAVMIFRWWYCLAVIPATILPSMVFRRSRNPGPLFALGIVCIIVAVAAGSLAVGKVTHGNP